MFLRCLIRTCKNACVFHTFEASHCPAGWILLADWLQNHMFLPFRAMRKFLVGLGELGVRQKSQIPGAWSSDISKVAVASIFSSSS